MSSAIIPGTNHEIIKMSSVIREPQMNSDKRRLIALFHLEERKTSLHKSLYSEEIIRPGTRIPRIKWIYTDHHIRAHPCDQGSIVNNLEGKISYKWLFYPVIEQRVAK